VIQLEETTSRLSSIATSPMYSQPKPPAHLCFSPTILQDEQSESIRNVLSPLDRNQTSKKNKPTNNCFICLSKFFVS
jgi:hypothetical protein